MYADTLGWIAAGLTLLTFSMRGMMALCLTGIAANVAFMSYGIAKGLSPVAALHAMLLLCNLIRLSDRRAA